MCESVDGYSACMDMYVCFMCVWACGWIFYVYEHVDVLCESGRLGVYFVCMNMWVCFMCVWACW